MPESNQTPSKPQTGPGLYFAFNVPDRPASEAGPANPTSCTGNVDFNKIRHLLSTKPLMRPNHMRKKADEPK